MNDDDLLASLRKVVQDDRSTEIPVDPLDAVTRARIAKAVLREVAPPRRVSPLRRAAMFAGPLAMAAALWLVFRSPDALPVYTVEVSAQAASTRGVEASGLTIDASGPSVRVEVVLRPATHQTTTITAFGFVRRQGSWVTAPGEIVVATGGAARLIGASESFRGADELRIVLGTQLDERSARAALDTEGDAVRVYRIAIH